MADHGTLTTAAAVPAAPTMVLGAYGVSITLPIGFGSLTTVNVNQTQPTFGLSDYRIAGTINIPDCPECPGPPTDGQVWPLTYVQG